MYTIIIFTVVMSYGIECIAAPRMEKQEKLTKKITLQSLNVMTLCPSTLDDGVKKSKHSIDCLCTRINQRTRNLKINTTLQADHDHNVHIANGVIPVEDKVIFIYSNGWSGRASTARYKFQGQALYNAYIDQQAGVIPGTCVCFDYPTHTRSRATFGQIPDQHCLLLVVQEVRRVNPHASIVLVGLCSGAMTILNFIAEHPDELQNVQAVILESPSISIEHIEKHAMRSKLGKLAKLVPPFFKYYFSMYNPHAPTIVSTAGSIPHNVPILIGAVTGDTVVAYRDVQKIVTVLRTHNHPDVWVYATDKQIKHAQMCIIPEWVTTVHDFLYHHNIGSLAKPTYHNAQNGNDFSQELYFKNTTNSIIDIEKNLI